jgi:hypothetical protein
MDRGLKVKSSRVFLFDFPRFYTREGNSPHSHKKTSIKNKILGFV